MKVFLIDTNILIEHFRGNLKARNFIEQNKDNSLISYITVGELLQGARDKKDLKNIENTLEPYNINHGSYEISELSMELIKKYCLKYKIGLFDSIIAATAIKNNLQLATLNLKHFKMIAGLKVINPIN